MKEYSCKMESLKEKQCLIMVGLPGSGKSTIAKTISEKYNYEYISSDEIRKKINNSDRYVDEKLVDINKLSTQAYTLMYTYAKEVLLTQNKKVVIDATHLDKEKRQNAVLTLLEAVEVTKISYVVVNTPVQLIESRMEKLKSQISSSQENIYDGWKRVYSIFENNFKAGIYSWPNTQLENRKFSIIDEVYIDQITI